MKPDIGLMGLVLVGSEGRMGRAIDEVVARQQGCHIVGRIDRGQADLPASINDAVILDFSSDDGTQEAIIASERLKTPLLVGTTGLRAETIAALQTRSKHVAVAHVSNTSLGIVLLEHLVRVVSTTLGGDQARRIEMDETHHSGKKDAPSGTAIFFGRSMLRIWNGITSGAHSLHSQG